VPDDAAPLDALSQIQEGREGQGSLVTPGAGAGPDAEGSLTLSVRSKSGGEEKSSIARSGRGVVEKAKPVFQPMRFKSKVPEGFVAKRKQVRSIASENYLQEFDSDEDNEDKEDNGGRQNLSRQNTGPAAGPASGGNGKSVSIAQGENPSAAPSAKPLGKSRSMPAGGGVAAILARRDPVRDRPSSAQKFREISANDSEMKVLYRYSNFRRMPLTEDQEQWANSRESKRIGDMRDQLKKVAEAATAAKTKKDKKGKDKKPEGKGSKKKAPPPPPPPKIIKKYSSASDFMDVHFPQFDTDENADCIGPMREEQLRECALIMRCLADTAGPHTPLRISEKTVRNALLVPQDRPEVVCLENTKNPIEGLMMNPLPKEYWRKMVLVGAKKKKKGGGKKKKK
jgi:hypothetical protein